MLLFSVSFALVKLTHSDANRLVPFLLAFPNCPIEKMQCRCYSRLDFGLGIVEAVQQLKLPSRALPHRALCAPSEPIKYVMNNRQLRHSFPQLA